jgi:hypothetical protein
MSRNLDIVLVVAERLGDLRDKVVFLGGAVTDLLITDPAAPAVRHTDDVDVIVDLASHAAYASLAARLRKLGFREDRSEDAPVCRWSVGGVLVDVMPTSAAVLGFGNRWYEPAIRHAEQRRVGRMPIRVVSAPYFLGTKLEAFDGRGHGDYMASRDLEDIVAVLDGRSEIVQEVGAAAPELREYLALRIGQLLDEPLFREAVSGHLPGDDTSQRRVPGVLQRLRKIAGRVG